MMVAHRTALTGSRIRERRLMLGRRQADLARALGISASYLNLIEHNRRPVAGRLLGAIARELQTEPAMLSDGAEAALLNGLREAAVGHAGASADLARVEEFVGRFPGWADLLVETHRRALGLQRTVEMLSDRMAHDPLLSASLHEVLSTVTAIRSIASILAETGDIDPDWRARFHANLDEESDRLANGAAALVRYLDEAPRSGTTGSTPQEEVDAWLAGTGYHQPALEGVQPPLSPEDLVAAAGLQSPPARELALRLMRRYRADAAAMPLEPFAAAVAQGCDPAALALRFGTGLAAVFRRLASLPETATGAPVGLAICDGSGTLTFRKPVEGFDLPRHSAACPLWPLYQALARPLQPLRCLVEIAGRSRQRFLCHAVSAPQGPVGFDQPQVAEALMLIQPEPAGADPAQEAQPIGAACRICPRAACAARREPSIMAEAF